MARVADVGRTQSLLRDAADGEHTATPSELARKRGAGAGELALRGERDPGDTRTAVAGCLADEQQPCFLPGFEVREEPLAAHGRAVTVTIEVERRADPRAPQPLDELLHPHPHSDRRRPAAGGDRARCRGVPGRGAALARPGAVR